RNQPPCTIYIQPVGSARIVHKQRERAVDVVFPDRVVRVVGEKYVACLVGGGAFGKAKLVANELQRSRRNGLRPCSGTQAECGSNKQGVADISHHVSLLVVPCKIAQVFRESNYGAPALERLYDRSGRRVPLR